MELLEFPNEEIWRKRNKWIEDEIENSIKGSHLVSDHATALFMDLQACYCIGAWLSVVILSISILDAHLRETETLNPKLGTAKLLDEYYDGDIEEINWLRKLRNKYVHVDLDNPALEMNAQYLKRSELEQDATKAIMIVIKTFFQSPGT